MVKSILVTGGSGFLGSHVIDSLLTAGYKVRIFDSKELPKKISGVDFKLGNILDKEVINEALENIDVIFHLAAFADLDNAQNNPSETMMVNVMGTTNLLEAAVNNSIKHVIFSSTIYVNSRTGSFYRVSKHSCELLLEEYFNRFGLNYTILRFGTLYGPRSDESNSIYNYLNEALTLGEMDSRGSGNEVREYIDVRDAADMCVKILKRDYQGETLIITGNHRMKLSELLEMINEILGDKIIIKYSDSKAAHYKYTPYSYNPRRGKKLMMDSYREIGQGLLEILEEIDNKK